MICGLTVSNAQIVENDPPDASFTAIIVKDIDQSLKWYSEVFGLETANRTDLEERGFSQANLRSADLWIELIELGSAVDPSSLVDNSGRTRFTGFFKFGVQVSDFDSWWTHLQKLEVTINGSVVTSEEGKRMVIILDPDGNRIQIFER